MAFACVKNQFLNFAKFALLITDCLVMNSVLGRIFISKVFYLQTYRHVRGYR